MKKGMRNGNMILTGNIKDEYANHQKAAVYVVSDYLSEQFEPIDTDNLGFSINLFDSYLILLLFLLAYIL